MVCQGDDLETIRPFLAKFGSLALFEEQVRIYNFQTFFKFERAFYTESGKDPKVNLQLMVSIYGNQAVQARYRSHKHSALTDAWALQQILEEGELKLAWRDWFNNRLVEE